MKVSLKYVMNNFSIGNYGGSNGKEKYDQKVNIFVCSFFFMKNTLLKESLKVPII